MIIAESNAKWNRIIDECESRACTYKETSDLRGIEITRLENEIEGYTNTITTMTEVIDNLTHDKSYMARENRCVVLVLVVVVVVVVLVVVVVA